MRIKPAEIEKQEFTVKFRGYDREEVRNFLLFLAEEVSGLLREMDDLRERLYRAEERIKELEARERILKETLIAAQRFSEELKNNARKEAEIIIKEAEMKAEQLLSKANEKYREITLSIQMLKSEKEAVLDNLKNFIASLEKLIKREEQEKLEDKEKVQYIAK